MQIPIMVRETVSGVVSFRTPPFDSDDYPLLVVVLLVHQIAGTTPEIEVTLQTSEDLETWESLGATLLRSTAGTARGAYPAGSVLYGRYLRFSIAITGTAPLVNYSLYANFFPST